VASDVGLHAVSGRRVEQRSSALLDPSDQSPAVAKELSGGASECASTTPVVMSPRSGYASAPISGMSSPSSSTAADTRLPLVTKLVIFHAA
jgi:hypothetical protein